MRVSKSRARPKCMQMIRKTNSKLILINDRKFLVNRKIFQFFGELNKKIFKSKTYFLIFVFRPLISLKNITLLILRYYFLVHFFYFICYAIKTSFKRIFDKILKPQIFEVLIFYHFCRKHIYILFSIKIENIFYFIL